MKVSDEIVRIIKESKFTAVPVTETSNIYTDLGFDSLAFVCLILKIEEEYSIKFELIEIGRCLRVDRLIAAVERKIKETCHD